MKFKTNRIGLLILTFLLGSIVAFAAYLTLLTQLGSATGAYVSVVTPVVAMLLSSLFEGYRWTPVAALGGVLAVAGNWLALAPARFSLRRPFSRRPRCRSSA